MLERSDAEYLLLWASKYIIVYCHVAALVFSIVGNDTSVN